MTELPDIRKMDESEVEGKYIELLHPTVDDPQVVAHQGTIVGKDGLVIELEDAGQRWEVNLSDNYEVAAFRDPNLADRLMWERVETPHGRGIVTDVDIEEEICKVDLPDRGPQTYSVDDVEVN